MNILLFALGSAGDVHPFIGLGLRLKARGHRITILANSYFEQLALRNGFEFVAIGSYEDFQATLDDPNLWKPSKGFKLVVKMLILRYLKLIYSVIEARNIPGETVIAAPVTAFGARLAEERLGIPLVSICLQPVMFRSSINPPVLGELPLSARMPRFWNDFWFWFADKVGLDPLLAPETNAFRAELGLPPLQSSIANWWLSPNHILGLFPEWFSPPRADWPAHVRLTGFPLYDESDAISLSPEVAKFLDDGPAPIVFSPGSAMRHGHEFFKAAVDACDRLGSRALFITRFPEQLPSKLPSTIAHFDFIPFSQVFPRAAGVVHHGGIGTTAQGLQAGVPQVVMPMAHDQPDNAAQLERLNVGRALTPRRFRGPALAQALATLFDNTAVTRACREARDRIHAVDPLDETCELIETAIEPHRNKFTSISKLIY